MRMLLRKRMDPQAPKHDCVLRNIVMASLVDQEVPENCQIDGRAQAIASPTGQQTLLVQRPRLSRSRIERITRMKQAYAASSACKVIAKTCTVDFIGPYLMGRPRIVTSSKSPVAPFSTSELLTSYNESRDRLIAESKLHVHNRQDLLTTSPERQSKQGNGLGSLSVDLQHRHRGKDKMDRHAGAMDNGMSTVLVGIDDSQTLVAVKAKNQFKPNGLRSSISGVGTFENNNSNGLKLHQGPLIVSGISQQNEYEREKEAENREQLLEDGSDSVWLQMAAQAQTQPSTKPQAPSLTPSSTTATQRTSLSHKSSSGYSHSGSSLSSSTKASKGISRKEVEPTYADPLLGAPTSLQARLAELSSLEAETVRWEKVRKLKKKSKERDD